MLEKDKIGYNPGKKFWEARKSSNKLLFETPEILWDSAVEYFNWVFDNPLQEAIVYQGELGKEAKPVMRAMSISGMCTFFEISTRTWDNYTDREGFEDVTDRIEQVIRTQKFEGAAAGFLNPTIIGRDIGQVEKQETIIDMSVSLDEKTDKELDEELEELLKSDD